MIKTRIQLDKAGKYKGIVNCASTIVKEEGPRALYKGLTPFVTHLTLKYAMRFATFGFFKQLLGADEHGSTTASKTFTAGVMSGVTEALCIVTPFEVVKIRLQQQVGTDKTALKYKNPIDAVSKIVRTEGIRALWKGALPTVIRQSSNQAINFTTMRTINEHLWGRRAGDGKKLELWKTLGSGFVAGSLGPCFNCPFDVSKTRIMAQETLVGSTVAPKYTGLAQTIRVVMAEEGLAALWKGLSLRILRVAPGQAITWTVVERVTSFFENREILKATSHR